MLGSKSEQFLLLLGQATSNARTKLHRMELQRIYISSPQWFQIVATSHPRRADNTMLRTKKQNETGLDDFRSATSCVRTTLNIVLSSSLFAHQVSS